MTLPDTLPLDAKGYTKRMEAHYNFGGGKGGATYSVRNELGQLMPISFQYDNRPKPELMQGFIIHGVQKEFKTWRELAEYWPTYIQSKATT